MRHAERAARRLVDPCARLQLCERPCGPDDLAGAVVRAERAAPGRVDETEPEAEQRGEEERDLLEHGPYRAGAYGGTSMAETIVLAGGSGR